MSDEPTDGVLGSLPRTRPHRRSAKRGPAAEPAAPPAPTTTAATTTTKSKAKPVTAAAKAAATPAATAKPKATATPAANVKAKATPAAKAKPKATAKAVGARGPASQAGAPVRSLQSSTAPRSADDRSRKPGVTSQAHHERTPGTGQPPVTRRSAPPAAEPAGAVSTAVQAAAELTEIGLKAGARALRGALSRLPRP